MGYIECLELAGARVLGDKFIGSYQGMWGAVIIYEGQKRLVTGHYGSCSVCDAFKAEFSWDEPETSFDEETEKYYNSRWDRSFENEITKEEYDKAESDYIRKKADFGKRYLSDFWDRWDIENRLNHKNPDEWYDEEERELLTWALTFFVD